MIYTIQIIAALFLLFVLSRTYFRYKSNEITLKEFIFWFGFWILVGIVVILPQTMSFLAGVLNVGRGVDVIIYIALMLLFYLNFKTQLKFEKLEQNISKIVREISFRKK